jgi:hypothetical protein
LKDQCIQRYVLEFETVPDIQINFTAGDWHGWNVNLNHRDLDSQDSTVCFSFCPIRHMLKNVGENKHFVYDTLLNEKVTEILILTIIHIGVYVFAKSVLQVKIWYIFNCSWVDTQWQQYGSHLHTNSTQNTENGTYRIIKKLDMQSNKKLTNLGSAGRAPPLRVIPWHLPYNWEKSTEKPQLV